MANKKAAHEPKERPYETTEVHLLSGFSPLLVQMIEKNRKALELELGKTVR